MNNLTEEQIKKILVDISNKWTNTDFSVVGSLFDLEEAQAKAVSQALIGKCATPTFSGGEKKSTCEYGLVNCSTCNPTEQKEYCEHPYKKYEQYCRICKQEIPNWQDNLKPIPAEKKEEKCPHGLERHYGCGRRTQPEPKPKDRIEPLSYDLGENDKSIIDTINQIVNFINNRKE